MEKVITIKEWLVNVVQSNKINVVGLGPGNIKYLSTAGIECIKEAEIIVGSTRQLSDLKAIKVAGGIFNTHSRVADGRMETMAACAFLVDEKPEIIRKILASNTIEEACDYIENKEIYHLIANRVAFKMQEYARADIEVSAAIFSFKGETIGESDNYQRMVGECGAIK